MNVVVKIKRYVTLNGLKLFFIYESVYDKNYYMLKMSMLTLMFSIFLPS